MGCLSEGMIAEYDLLILMLFLKITLILVQWLMHFNDSVINVEF